MIHRYIAIEGNIGTGKTALANQIANEFDKKILLEEFEDNSFLPRFYENARQYAFPLEMSFLASRFNQLKKKLYETDLFNHGIVTDYIFFKCLIFSKVNLDDDEYDLYIKLFDIINLQLPKPDLLVYLHKPIDKLQENIKKRGRLYENEISNDYLQKIQDGYFEYMYKQNDQKILLIDTTHLDFVNNYEDYQFILSKIELDYPLGVNVIN
ncbi:MAG: deoxynucleoside kinase [Bacteroidetes bacterium]|nr:deoxynucleoside kinase [Bacteroidota bacterium]